MMGLIERHGIVRDEIARGPGRDHRLFFPVHNRYLFGRGNIYKDARTALLQLERFRMALELDVRDSLPACSVENAECAVAIAYVDTPCRSVVADIVGIVG